LKYNTRTDFQRSYNGAYDAVHRKPWLGVIYKARGYEMIDTIERFYVIEGNTVHQLPDDLFQAMIGTLNNV